MHRTLTKNITSMTKVENPTIQRPGITMIDIIPADSMMNTPTPEAGTKTGTSEDPILD